MSTLNQAMKTFNQRQATEAALKNEQLTRERVTRLEERLEAEAQRAERWRTVLADFYGRRFTERLRWIIRGR